MCGVQLYFVITAKIQLIRIMGYQLKNGSASRLFCKSLLRDLDTCVNTFASSCTVLFGYWTVFGLPRQCGPCWTVSADRTRSMCC